MKITIVKIIEISPTRTHIEFTSPYGNGLSYLCGLTPEEGQTLDVEIDIDDTFRWNQTIKPATIKAPSLSFDSEGLHINAELSFSEDGCGTLMLGDSIALISLEPPPAAPPFFVNIILKEARLHATNI